MKVVLLSVIGTILSILLLFNLFYNDDNYTLNNIIEENIFQNEIHNNINIILDNDNKTESEIKDIIGMIHYSNISNINIYIYNDKNYNEFYKFENVILVNNDKKPNLVASKLMFGNFIYIKYVHKMNIEDIYLILDKFNNNEYFKIRNCDNIIISSCNNTLGQLYKIQSDIENNNTLYKTCNNVENYGNDYSRYIRYKNKYGIILKNYNKKKINEIIYSNKCLYESYLELILLSENINDDKINIEKNDLIDNMIIKKISNDKIDIDNIKKNYSSLFYIDNDYKLKNIYNENFTNISIFISEDDNGIKRSILVKRRYNNIEILFKESSFCIIDNNTNSILLKILSLLNPFTLFNFIKKLF